MHQPPFSGTRRHIVSPIGCTFEGSVDYTAALEMVVDRVFDRRDVNPPTMQTMRAWHHPPWAAAKGHESVVKQPLDQQEVNPDNNTTFVGCIRRAQDTSEPTFRPAGHEWKSYSWNGRMLARQHGGIGRTPLSYAAGNGLEGVVGVTRRAGRCQSILQNRTKTL